MRKFLKVMFLIVFTLLVAACGHGGEMRTHSSDAAVRMSESAKPSEACQNDEACLKALAKCREGLSRDSATDQLKALEECRDSFRPQVSFVALPVPVCGGPYMNVSDCSCRMSQDGTGDKNPLLVSARAYSTNLVSCVTRAELLYMVVAMNRRILAIEGKVAGWDGAKRKVDKLFVLLSKGDEKDIVAEWDEILTWYVGAKNALTLWRNDITLLYLEDRQARADDLLFRFTPASVR